MINHTSFRLTRKRINNAKILIWKLFAIFFEFVVSKSKHQISRFLLSRFFHIVGSQRTRKILICHVQHMCKGSGCWRIRMDHDTLCGPSPYDPSPTHPKCSYYSRIKTEDTWACAAVPANRSSFMICGACSWRNVAILSCGLFLEWGLCY